MAHRLIALTLLLAFPLAAQTIPDGYRQVAAQWQVPAELLYALALTESGLRLSHGVRPWPWTLNVAGKSYRYPTQARACQALHRFIHTTPAKRIDVGPGQINLGWHRHRVASPCELLLPYRNLHLTARILRERYEERPGSWLDAAARYHRPAGGTPAQRYRNKVQRYMSTLTTVERTP